MSTDSSARLLISCGSLLLQTGAVPEAIHADAALVSDVDQELSYIRLGTPALAIPLARGQTTATLLARARTFFPELREFSDALLERASVDLRDGLGMLAYLGRVAGLVALEDDHVRARIDKDLTVPLMQLRNGTLRRINIWAMNSLAGGVGSLTGPLFAGVVATSVRELSQAVIEILAFQVGALTFLGLGDRILDNTAAGLIEQLALIKDRDRDPRESRQLVLTELPTVDSAGNQISSNGALRSALAVSLASAYATRQVQEQIQTGRTNRALGSSFGEVTLLRADWFGSLGRDDVVADAAAYYLHQLDDSNESGQAVPTRLDYMETALHSLKSPAELAAAVSRSRGRRPESFDTDVFAEQRCAVVVRLDGVSAGRACAAASNIAVAEGHGPAMGRLRAASSAIRAALNAERVSESRLAARADVRKMAVLNAVAVLFPGGATWPGVQKFLAGPRRAVEEFSSALSCWREAQARHAVAAARTLALELAASQVDSAIQRLNSMVARLRSTLETLAGSATRSVLVCAPLSQVSAQFLRCILSGDVPLLRSHLARSISQIAPEGLAVVLKANGSQPAEIVARLVSAPLFASPFWGGGEPSASPFFSAIVLPPVPPAYMASLQEAALQAGLRRTLFCGDTFAGGASVIAIEAYEVRSIFELFPPPYMSGLRQIAGPKKSLYPLGCKAQDLMKTLLNGNAA